MDANLHLYRDLMTIFVAAIAGGLVAWLLRLPLIVGYVLGGIVISPFTPGFQISDVHTFEELAEVGVVLLMFSIGVEFSLKDLLKVKWVAALGGPIGIAMSIGLAWCLGKLLGWSIAQSVVIGAALSVASTMVLARFLTDRGALSTTWGRVTIGITLVEDLAVVLMTVLIPTFAGSSEGQWARVGWVLGKAVVLLIPLGFLALKIIPILLRWVGKTGDDELMLLAAVAICLGTAAAAYAVGFSLALGAFLAGLAISGAKDLHHAHDKLIPLRDAFVALFFVSLGTLIEPQVLRHSLPLLAAMIALIIVGKFLVWMIVVTLFRYPARTAIAAAAGLTQIGELSFVVVRVARSVDMVGDDVFNAALAASLISIFLNVFIVRVAWKGLASANNSDSAHANV
jgi:monovalent cation:H+ antiporter-2, CPA2 family